jgi:DNA polymerase III epsilon subunit-like protein
MAASIVFDVETTGLRPGQIAQLSAIKLADGKASGFNAWFRVKEMEDGAAKANGLSVSILKELSGGNDFYARIGDIMDLFDGVDSVYGYNVNFDRKFLEAEFTRCSLFLPNMAYSDVMADVKADMQVKRGFKLSDAVAHYGLADKVARVVKLLFGAESNFHDARHDAAATFLVARRLNRI